MQEPGKKRGYAAYVRGSSNSKQGMERSSIPERGIAAAASLCSNARKHWTDVSLPRSIAQAFPSLQGLQLFVAADVRGTMRDLCQFKTLELLTLVHLKVPHNFVASLPGMVLSLKQLQLFRCRLAGGRV